MNYEAERNAKLWEMAENTIKTVIPRLMENTEYEWNLNRDWERNRYILQIRLKRHKMLVITLGYATLKRIPEILQVIQRAMEAFDSLPFPVDIRNYGNDVSWISKKKADKP